MKKIVMIGLLSVGLMAGEFEFGTKVGLGHSSSQYKVNSHLNSNTNFSEDLTKAGIKFEAGYRYKNVRVQAFALFDGRSDLGTMVNAKNPILGIQSDYIFNINNDFKSFVGVGVGVGETNNGDYITSEYNCDYVDGNGDTINQTCYNESHGGYSDFIEYSARVGAMYNLATTDDVRVDFEFGLEYIRRNTDDSNVNNIEIFDRADDKKNIFFGINFGI